MDYLRIGLVVKPQGIKGELKIMPMTDDPNRFKGLKQVYVEQGKEHVIRSIANVSVRNDAIIITVEGIETREAAEAMRGKYLCVDRQNAVKLPDGRYFVVDLIGCTVEDTNGTNLGKLNDVYETGANDVYTIKGKRSLMVPALKKLIKSVDIANKRMVLDAQVLEEVAVWDEI